MKKRTLTRVASSLLVLLLAVVLLVSAVMPAFAEQAYEAAYIKQLDSVNTNYEQYLDGSVVQKLPDTVKDTDEISVIVQLDGSVTILDAYQGTDKTMSLPEYALSEEAMDIRKNINAERKRILAALDEEGISYTAGANYNTVLAGFEIVIVAKDFEDTCDILGDSATAIVGEVYEPCETQLVENEVDYYEDTGIFDTSDYAYDGSGMVVAVLDTGLDYTHSAFDVSRFTSSSLGLTKEQVAAILADTEAAARVEGLTADDVYLNDKVPFSFDYADSDPDVYSIHNNHGTHVSGVIVGKDDVITGVAPNAQLVSMKIFSDTYDSARTSWILAALDDCVALGVDVINMSLGTACGFSREMDKEAVGGVYDKIRAAGISMVVAASNSYNSTYGSEKNGNLGLTSNPDSATVGSPSTYDGALSVASIMGEKTPYLLYGDTIMYFVEASNSAQDEKNFFNEILPAGTDSMKVEYVVIPGSGRPADYTGLDMTGKIALVRRGSTTFEEKANAAQKAGALGIIVYNNVAGDIKMNSGTTTIPICSIGQDDGELLAAAGGGTLSISRDQKSGPFISDFSSWGPTPDLGIKPEITAHGGNILSAVTGGTYDRLSGTSMACPNMAGFVALLRQYVTDAFPEIANDPVEVAALVNRLFMSTADIMFNKNGLPYAVRKQGAGLANLTSATETTAYIMTYDRLDGSLMDKTKIELGDDPDKTGVYTLTFSVNNFGTYDLTYDLNAYVMTEGVSDTRTHKGETTVTEEGYILGGATVTVISVDGEAGNGKRITVPAGSIVDLTVQITLSNEDKKYLDESFENGMYVEGFITLDAVSGTEVDLVTPYLAFYGDWSEAPIFDLDYFETNKDELDDSIATLDKTLPDAYATRPIGGIELDYVNYLGSYYFLQDPKNQTISANREYVSLSNVEGTIKSFRYVWAGMLRNAARIVITVTDSSTGEVVFERTEYDVRKSYGDGGSIYPANVDVEFDAAEHNLKNNTKYDVKLQAYLDYDNDGLETNKSNTFEFPLYADFQAPAITDCEFYTEYDKANYKMRLYAKMAVYDNHYAMAMQVGYITLEQLDGQLSPTLKGFDRYPVPVYSNRNDTTYVTYELTDYIYDIKANAYNKNTFTVACYDYALNEATYEIPLPDEFIDFYFEADDELTYDAETDSYALTLSPNQVYSLNPLAYPTTEWADLLEYSCANTKVAKVVNNRVIAVGSGVATIIVKSPNTDDYTTVRLTVLSEDDPNYRWFDKPVADVFKLTGYETLKAYYFLSNTDRDIGATGDEVIFNTTSYSLAMFPSESVWLKYKLDAYFPEATEVIFESSNDKIVTIDQNGVITAQAEGFSSVSVRVLLDGNSTFYSETVEIEVKDPFVTNNGPVLNNYFGLGGTVTIPEDLMITSIGNYAFSNYDYIAKGEGDEISDEDPTTTKITFLGDSTIKKVIIPEGVESIGAYAFANLTALEEVVIPSTLMSIEYGAFYGCTNLKKVTGIEHVKLFNKEAFFGCNLSGTISLDNAHAISDYAFAGNKNLKQVILPETVSSIGAYAFAADTSLSKVTVKAESPKYGQYVFTGCTALTEFEANTAVIPAGAFAGCTALTKITIGKDVNVIGEFAFYDTGVASFTVAAGNTVFKSQENGSYLTSADGTTLLLVSPTVSGTFTLNDSAITTVGSGAFSANSKIKEVVMPHITSVRDYAFYSCVRLATVTLGELSFIGDYAFASTSLTELPSFADDLSEIGKYAFSFTSLTEVEIPSGMHVGEGAFAECNKITKIVINDGVTVGEGAFMLDRNMNLIDPEEESTLDEFSYVDPDTGKRIYFYVFKSALTTLEIGNDVVIGDAAFFGASALTSVTLGDNVSIGDRAFYNASSLTDIDLSRVKYIGELAFSGDVHYTFTDQYFTSYYIKGNSYVYRYYSPKLRTVDLSSLEYIGNQAFQYCRELESVTLGENLTTVSANAFGACEKLSDVNLEHVVYVKENAFSETAITKADLSGAISVDEYAFIYVEELTELILSPDGTSIGEGAFGECAALGTATPVINLEFSEYIGEYAFAYTGITEANLSAAKSIGDFAFMKDLRADGTRTPFAVTLGEAVEYIGDNPFAMCALEPFTSSVVEKVNGVEYIREISTFDISDNVKVIDGSLYCVVPYGLELTVYTGTGESATVADGTVRLTALSFAGSDVVNVHLPHTLNSVGDKAFYKCDSLSLVEFKSYYAPILEEEFDQNYHDSYDNIPATGEYEFNRTVDSSNTETVYKQGLGIVPYYMWNVATGTKYSNVYYGANFVDRIGYYDADLIMISPSNGESYETFIYGQYFKTVINGALAADDVTLAAIKAINALPNPVLLEHEALVIAAREAYDRIGSPEQRALITDLYAALQTAEKRISVFKQEQNQENTPDEAPDTQTPVTDGDKGNDTVVAIIVTAVLIAVATAAILVRYFADRKNKAAPSPSVQSENEAPIAAQEENGNDSTNN
ncbi:MAG: leucine-rich repeat protein [Clostridia bacterium]|nr:leucine-rich repeat protein [Clostridia bacterium]